MTHVPLQSLHGDVDTYMGANATEVYVCRVKTWTFAGYKTNRSMGGGKRGYHGGTHCSLVRQHRLCILEPRQAMHCASYSVQVDSMQDSVPSTQYRRAVLVVMRRAFSVTWHRKNENISRLTGAGRLLC